MHREIRDDIESLLGGSKAIQAGEHLSQCEECRGDVEAMAAHSALLRDLKTPPDVDTDLRPGFYARVMERIEAEGPVSIWNMFVESAFGKRIAFASVALALLLGVYLISSERSADDPIVSGQTAGQIAGQTSVAGQGVAGQTIVAGQVSVSGQGIGAADQASAPVVPASALEGPGGAGLTLPDPGQMFNQLNDAASQDDILVNLVTYREQ